MAMTDGLSHGFQVTEGVTMLRKHFRILILAATAAALLISRTSWASGQEDPAPQAGGEGALCGGLLGLRCGAGFYCDNSAAPLCGATDATGICRALGACPAVVDPVCACSGRTYANLCELAQASEFKAHDGPCVKRPCVPSEARLCLDDRDGDDRFDVALFWDNGLFGGVVGAEARAISLDPLRIYRSGLFWFFSMDSPEMLVRVLNACAINNRYWVFASAATHFGYLLTVRDTQTNQFRTYVKPPGETPVPVMDTNAFSCP